MLNWDKNVKLETLLIYVSYDKFPGVVLVPLDRVHLATGVSVDGTVQGRPFTRPYRYLLVIEVIDI